MTSDLPAEGAAVVFLVGLISHLSTNLDNLLLLAAACGGRADGWRKGGLALLLAGIVVLAATLAVGAAASHLTSGHIGWLGLVPIALGLRGFWLALRGDADTEPAAVGLAGLVLVVLANSGDTLAVLIPTYADTSPDYLLPLLAGFLCGPLAGAAVLRPILNHAGLKRLLARVGPWLAPAIMVLAGTYVLLNTPSDMV